MSRHFDFLAFLLLTGALFRGLYFERMAVEHFDEGVYAANFYSDLIDFRYPDQHLYAPPLFPELLEWALIFGGGSPQAVMWVNVILGTLLILAVWWVTSLLAGEKAADIAALLVTFDDTLIQYSRAALTDIPVSLWIVLGVGTILQGIRTGLPQWIGLGALCATLAWWTKYNGWLALAITGAGVAGWLLFDKSPRQSRFSTVLRWGMVACLTCLLWSPVLWELQNYGGYAAVARNHAGYIVGLTGWWNSAQRHLFNERYDTHFAMLGFACAIAWNLRSQLSLRVILVIVGVTAAVWLTGDLMILLMLAPWGMWQLGRNESDRGLNWWMLLAWLIGLGLSTPMYYPYPRLILPLKLGLTIVSAAALESIIAAGPVKARIPRSLSAAVIVLLLSLSLAILSRMQMFPAYADRTAFARLTPDILRTLSDISEVRQADNEFDLNAVIYVVGIPGLYYHLAAAEGDQLSYVTQPVSDLSLLVSGKTDARVPTFLLVEPTTAQSELLKQKAVLSTHFDYRPSPLVVFDDLTLHERLHDVVIPIELWQLK